MATSHPSARCLFGAAMLLFAPAAAFAAEPPVTEVSPIRAVLLTFECEARTLPTQREVGAALGQYNFNQVYASRARLMSEVGRACQRPGAERVDVVLQSLPATPRDARYLAVLAAPAR